MEIELKDPDIRRLKDMRGVLMDDFAIDSDPEKELYYMYRGVRSENGLRYDITVIPPCLIGDEYVKTKGHFHCDNKGEIYIVIKGEALFLFQKGTEEVEDVYAVKAEAGESVIIPAGYGHVTINPGNETLELANWVSPECVSDYKSIMDRKGACYYYSTKGWIKNDNYKNVPEIRFEEPLKQVPQDLDFLK
ncbi:MAG: glucose-6-phosphate isomerase family protein [Candidatus Paceibacterota bacterium]